MIKPARLIHFFQVNRFRREILIALVVKFSLLVLIASYCFSHSHTQPLPSHLVVEGLRV